MESSASIISTIKSMMENHPAIQLCILFGSVAEQRERFDSDLDVAVAGQNALGIANKKKMIEELATAFGRPVDLIDLQTTSGTLLHQVLTKGTLIYCDDHTLYAEIMKKMLFNQTDMMPYHHRILKERREKWINE